MNNVNKTLYIPLYGKAFVSRAGIILRDKTAEKIWESEGFALRGKAKSKWLAYYMGMRSAVFDAWVRKQIEEHGDAVVIHIGCGLDSRVERVGVPYYLWYDVDFPEVIAERLKYFTESERYKMLSGDARRTDWLEEIPRLEHAIVVMEGVSMYVSPDELCTLFAAIRKRFSSTSLLVDCYSSFAAKASKFKNPINSVGVTEVFGINSPKIFERGTGLNFMGVHDITPERLIKSLRGIEKIIFKKLYGGNFAKKLYKLYEYGAVSAVSSAEGSMKKYEYVNVKISRFLGARSEEHRKIINKYAEMGYRYVGFIPTVIEEYGKITSMDLVFERDEA